MCLLLRGGIELRLRIWRVGRGGKLVSSSLLSFPCCLGLDIEIGRYLGMRLYVDTNSLVFVGFWLPVLARVVKRVTGSTDYNIVQNNGRSGNHAFNARCTHTHSI